MKQLLYILLFFLFPFSFSAKNAIGFVIDEDGEPIPYASVYVKNNPIGGTMTDLEGRYELKLDKDINLAEK